MYLYGSCSKSHQSTAWQLFSSRLFFTDHRRPLTLMAKIRPPSPASIGCTERYHGSVVVHPEPELFHNTQDCEPPLLVIELHSGIHRNGHIKRPATEGKDDPRSLELRLGYKESRSSGAVDGSHRLEHRACYSEV